MNKHKDCLCLEGCTVNPQCPIHGGPAYCTCLPNSKNSMCLVHSIRDNKYRYKPDLQILMMAVSEMMRLELERNKIDTPELKELEEELSWRGRRVNKASMFWPNAEIKRRDYE